MVMELRLAALERPQIMSRALVLVDRYFKDIASVQKITINVYKDTDSDYIRKKMEHLGWNIVVTEHGSDIDDSSSDDENRNYM